MDYDAVEMILDELKDYALTGEDAQRVKDLAGMLRVLDWSGMESLLGALSKEEAD